MINWKIENGNLELADGSIVRITSDDAIIQNLKATLYHWREEWFLDSESGIDYKNRVLTRHYNPVNASREIKKAVKNAEGIRIIDNFDLRREGSTLFFTLAATTINNTTIRLSEEFTI